MIKRFKFTIHSFLLRIGQYNGACWLDYRITKAW